MKKILLTLSVVSCIICGGQVWAEWVDVDHVINGNTFVTTSGEVVNIIGLSRTPATQMTTFFLEENDVWLDRKKTDDSGHAFAVVDLHGDISYSLIVDDHKYDKSSDTVVSNVTNNKYHCNATRYHWKSPHPYSLAGARRIRRMAKNHRKTWEECYGTSVESVTIAGTGGANRISGMSFKDKRAKRELSKLRSEIRAIDKNIETKEYTALGKRNVLRHKSMLMGRISDLEAIQAGVNPSTVAVNRRGVQEKQTAQDDMRDDMRAIARQEAIIHSNRH